MSNHLTSLPQLATTINQHHQAAQEHAQSAIQHAIKCGEELLKAKAQVKRGDWLPWIKDNFKFSERTAQGYMKLSSNTQRVADMGVKEALAHLAEPKQSKPEDAKEKLKEALYNARDAISEAMESRPNSIAFAEVKQSNDHAIDDLLNSPDVDWWGGIHSERLTALIAETERIEAELGEPMPDDLKGVVRFIWTSSGLLESILINQIESRNELAHLMEARNKECRTKHHIEDIKAWKKSDFRIERLRKSAHKIAFENMKGCTPPADFECACGKISGRAAA